MGATVNNRREFEGDDNLPVPAPGSKLEAVLKRWDVRTYRDVLEVLGDQYGKAEPEIAERTLGDLLRRDPTRIGNPGGWFRSVVERRVLDAWAADNDGRAPASQARLDFTPAPAPEPPPEPIDATVIAALVLEHLNGDVKKADALPADEQARIAGTHPLRSLGARLYSCSFAGMRPTTGHLLGALECCRVNPAAERFFVAAFTNDQAVDGKVSSAARALANDRIASRSGKQATRGLSPITDARDRTVSAWNLHRRDRVVARLTGAVNGAHPQPVK
jgi:hypothetical protein